MSRKFWNWVKNKDDSRTLYLNGVIAEETWWGDEVTPKMFKDELMSGSGDVIVWINSPGGDVFAAAQIYNMLMEYMGRVTVKIDGMAASAASVIAMAGGDVYMSPVSMMMIHNPATIAIGDSEEMLKAKALLDEVKESIINAYELKSSLPRAKIGRLMDQESWMNANKAVELGFADDIMYKNENGDGSGPEAWRNRAVAGIGGMLFSRQTVMNSVLMKMPRTVSQKAETAEPPKPEPAPEPKASGVSIESLEKRLSLLTH